MKFIEFLYSLKNDTNSNLIESIGLGYSAVFESKVDFEKYSLVNKRIDALVPMIVDYYVSFLGKEDIKLLSKEDARSKRLYLKIGKISDKYNHLSDIPIILTPYINDMGYYNHGPEKVIIIPIASTFNDLFSEFRHDFLSEIKKYDTDREEKVSYLKLVKEYREKIKRLVNTSIRGILAHEIVHAIDDSMYHKSFEYTKEIEPQTYEYYNLPEEINAYIIGLLSKLPEEDIDKSFKEIINTESVKEYLDLLFPNNRKRALKRIYSIIADRLVAV